MFLKTDDFLLDLPNIFSAAGTNESKSTKIYSGKQPQDLPKLSLKCHTESTGGNNEKQTTLSLTGPEQGLLYVRRKQPHLSAGDHIDFIDEKDTDVRHESTKTLSGSTLRKKSSEEGILDVISFESVEEHNDFDIANMYHWNSALSNDNVYGISISLYEKNPISNEYAGSPIAGKYCFLILFYMGFMAYLRLEGILIRG